MVGFCFRSLPCTIIVCILQFKKRYFRLNFCYWWYNKNKNIGKISFNLFQQLLNGITILKENLQCAILVAFFSDLLSYLYFYQMITLFHLVSFFTLQTFTAEWKRKAFFKFVSVFHDQSWPQELKAKVLLISYVFQYRR